MTEWTWRCEDRQGKPVGTPLEDAAPPVFDNRSDAESWLGETYPELAQAGVHQVVLLHDDEVVYGPMGLDPV